MSQTLALPTDVDLYVDMSGMSTLPLPGQRIISLDTFDPDAQPQSGDVMLNSPRSVEACLRLGIRPQDLLRPQKAPSEIHYVETCRRRAALLHQARVMRRKVAAEFDARLAAEGETAADNDGRAHSATTSRSPLRRPDAGRASTAGAATATMGGAGGGVGTANAAVERERERLRKLAVAEDRRRQTFEAALEDRKARQVEREQAAAKRLAERQRQQEEQRAAAAAQAEELARRRDIFEATREAVEESQLQVAEERADEVESRAARKRWALELKRQEAELDNAIQLSEQKKRRALMLRRQREAQISQKQQAEERLQRAEQAKRNIEVMERRKREEQVRKAEQNARLIVANRDRIAEVNQHTLERQTALQEDAAQHRQRIAEMRDAQQAARREHAARQEAIRRAALEQAKEEEEQKASELARKAAYVEAAQELMVVQRDVGLRKRQLTAAVKAEERAEALQRQQRAEEYKRYQLMQQLLSKKSKAETRQQQLAAVVAEHRQAMDRRAAQRLTQRSRQVPGADMPGPGEYDTSHATAVLSEFGALASGVPLHSGGMASRTALQAPRGAVPGPGTYNPGKQAVAPSRRVVTIPRAPRFDRKDEDEELDSEMMGLSEFPAITGGPS
eukprot:TRINITY_DN2460_c0_g1_i2.p1 TRINITY_DN2460_c0_g1~~TRINITY_DN2460_c0_g1_i2.p1  ORF type:complete len:621 (-),score=146.72 TRINITY_DN2460_c0_g1_i2:141-2003(-)